MFDCLHQDFRDISILLRVSCEISGCLANSEVSSMDIPKIEIAHVRTIFPLEGLGTACSPLVTVLSLTFG